jgi:hypothetical protein
MSWSYCICKPPDGLLYVQVPTFDQLVHLLLEQRFARDAHFHTSGGYVPYYGGALALDARYLGALGVRPLWYPKGGARDDQAIAEAVKDGVYADEGEALMHQGFRQYAGECEWTGPAGMRFDPKRVARAYVWGPAVEKSGRSLETALRAVQALAPRAIVAEGRPPKTPNPCKVT